MFLAEVDRGFLHEHAFVRSKVIGKKFFLRDHAVPDPKIHPLGSKFYPTFGSEHVVPLAHEKAEIALAPEKSESLDEIKVPNLRRVFGLHQANLGEDGETLPLRFVQ